MTMVMMTAVLVSEVIFSSVAEVILVMSQKRCMPFSPHKYDSTASSTVQSEGERPRVPAGESKYDTLIKPR